MKITDELVTILLNSMILAVLIVMIWIGVHLATVIIDLVRRGTCC